MKQNKFSLYNVIAYFFMGIVVVISVFPFIWVLLSSFKTNNEILESAFTIPMTPSFVGYQIAIEAANIPMRFLTSIFIASSTTILSVIFYSMAAYVLARFEFKGRNIIFGILICSLLIPANAMIQPIYTVIKALGLYDTKYALILVYTGTAIPMSLFILRSYFLSIPKALEEAASIEGAGYIQTFVYVMLPIAKPAIASASVLIFIGAWNEFLYAMLLTSSESNRTLPLTIKYFTSMFSFNYTAMFAALVMCILPTITVYIFMQEQIMESMVAGSVKG